MILLGIFITYVMAPVAAYLLIAPAYSSDKAKAIRFRTFVIATGFGPIGISLLLFLLFTVAPGHGDWFYINCIVTLILLAAALRFNAVPNLLKRLTLICQRDFFPHLDESTKQILRVFVIGAARIIPTIFGLLLLYPIVINFESTPVNFLVVIGAIVVTILAIPVLGRDLYTVSLSIVQLARLVSLSIVQLARLVIPILGRSQFFERVERKLLLAFGITLIIGVAGLTLYVGLGVPLIDSDPIEYAVVSRAIYHAKSLAAYFILTGLPDSGFIAHSSHPPAFPLLEVWGYFFDGPMSTRMLRLPSLFYFFNLALLMYVVLQRYGKVAPILGVIFLFGVPYLPYLASAAHIDPMRIYFFFLSLVLVADVIKHNSFPRVLICGVAVGFCLYAHSIGILCGLIAGAAYFLLAGIGLRQRIANSVIIGATAALVGGAQYLKNIIDFGTPVLEYEPVWRIPELHESTTLAYQRMLATPIDVLWNGVLQNFTMVHFFGLVAVLSIIPILITVPKLWRDDLTSVMLVAIIMFYGAVITLTLAGSLLAVKNARYMLTIMPAFCVLAAVATAKIPRRFSSTPLTGPSLRSSGYVLILMGVVIGYSVPPLAQGSLAYSRFALVWQGRDVDFAKDPMFWYEPVFRYFAEHPPSRDSKILVFEQAEHSFYGNHRWIDHLDPVLLDFYHMTNKTTAYEELRRLNVSHLLVADAGNQPAAYFNSQASEVVADPRLADLMVHSSSYLVYRLHPAPTEVHCTALVPTGAVTQSLLPISYRSVLRRIFVRTPFPVLQQELSLRSASEFHRLPESAPLEGLASVEFRGISIPEDVRERPDLRLYLTVEAGGEGLGEIFLKSRVASGAVSERLVWNGLLDPSGHDISVQTLLPAGVTDLSVLMRKPHRYMRLALRGIKLCLFEGPPSPPKE